LLKYSCFVLPQITCRFIAVPPRQEGRTRRHERGAGCGGRGCDARRAARTRTAKSCGPGAPTLMLRSRSDPRTTGAKEPGPRGEHEISRKTIAQGRPDDPAPPVGDYCVLTTNAHGPRVRAGTRSSLRPLILRVVRTTTRASRAARTRSCIWPPFAKRRSDEAIHRSFFAARWIASFSQSW
jgi:hypothetical protein